MRSMMVLVLSGLMVLGQAVSASAMGDAGFVQQTLIGNKAPDFTLTTLRGQQFNLTKDASGKKAMILFWTTWCPHCREAIKEINQKLAELAGKNITVIFLNVAEPKESVERYLAEHHYDFDVVLDQDQSVSDAYGLVGVPTLIYINEQGVVKSVEHGFEPDYAERF